MKIEWSQDRNSSRKIFGKRCGVVLFTITNYVHNVNLHTNLPGLKIKEPWQETIPKAQAMAELMFSGWLDAVQLVSSPEHIIIEPDDTNRNKPFIIPKA